MSLSIIIVIVALIALFMWRTRPRYIKGIPYPPHAPYLGILPTVLRNKDRIHAWRREACAPFIARGDEMVQRLTPARPPYVDMLSSRCVEYMLSRDKDTKVGNFDNFVKGPIFRSLFKEVLGDGIFAADGERWQTTRKVASHMFSARVLNNQMERVFLHHGKVFVDLIASLPADQPFDIQSYFFRFTMDSICEIAFGKKLDSLHQEVPFARAFDACQEQTVNRMFVPFGWWPLLKTFGSQPERDMTKNAKVINDFVYDIIAQRRTQKMDDDTDYADLVTLFMRDSEKKNPGDQPSDVELRDLIMNFLLAGRDTTACALTWIIYCLSTHRDVEEKLLAEIKEHVGNSLPTTENTKNMTYIDAVFAETVRLYPPVPIDTKTCVADCVFPNGVTIPAGTICGYSPLLFGRMESQWGSDAAEFRPERWIDKAEATGKPLQQCANQYSYIHFNAGPRLCLGKAMAFLEAKTLLCMLLPRYRLTMVAGHDISPRVTVIYQMKHGLRVTASPRDTPSTAASSL